MYNYVTYVLVYFGEFYKKGVVQYFTIKNAVE